jgi:hypothetical protein
MSPKGEQIGLRTSGELKKALTQIAKKEGRSLAQICELFLKGAIHLYEKEGSNYIRHLLDQGGTKKSG